MDIGFFDYNGVNKVLCESKEMKVSVLDLCRCTLTVGYINRKGFARSSWRKALSLWLMVEDNVEEVKMQNNREFILKNQFFGLDPSEKVAVSYELGQGLTKAVAEYDNIPWLGHCSAYKKAGYSFISGSYANIITAAGTSAGGKEPDLVGYDLKKHIHLFEAKGVSRENMPQKTVDKAINQVTHYTDIQDPKGRVQAFETRKACLFNFKKTFHGQIITPIHNKTAGNQSVGKAAGDGYEDKMAEERYMIGFLEGICRYYSLFLGIEEPKKNGYRDEVGFAFSLCGQQYFLGLKEDCWYFLKGLFHKSVMDRADVGCLDMDDYEKKTGEILEFFEKYSEKGTIYGEEDSSMGIDGVILRKWK